MNNQMEAMCRLGMTKEEIAEVLEADKMIDQGIKLFELTPEQEKASKQVRQADRKPKAYDLDNTGGKRNKKADDNKKKIVNRLTDTLENWFESDNQCTYNACTNIEITNPEREFTFTYNGTKYRVTLSAPRS